MGADRVATLHDVIPAPARVEPAAGVRFVLSAATRIVAGDGSAAVAEYLAGLLRPATGYVLPVLIGTPPTTPGIIALELAGSDRDQALGDEGYRLSVNAAELTLTANTPAGLFRAVQTIRQLLPARIAGGTVQSGPWTVPGGLVVDRPRFAYRAMMLDVARRFFGVAHVRRVIELAALHKLNHLHLHLTDDQGWRIPIDRWPRLSTYGGGTQVGGGPGGCYTKDDFRDIVAYAAEHFITIVPEVDLPGHTNAALASYPELTGDGIAPPRYTGTEVGFSALCADREVTLRFIDDVFSELAALTPGEYLHIGGDEATTLSTYDYAAIVGRTQDIVVAHGKTVVGWHEIAAARLAPSTVLQFWGVTRDSPELLAAAARGNRVILSPATHTYLDMKYDERTALGHSWARDIGVKDAYDWDPATHLAGLGEASILGVEAPLWTETVRSVGDVEFLAFPRLAAIAELGWSPESTHDWDSFRRRLAVLGRLWDALAIGFYRSPDIDW